MKKVREIAAHEAPLDEYSARAGLIVEVHIIDRQRIVTARYPGDQRAAKGADWPAGDVGTATIERDEASPSRAKVARRLRMRPVDPRHGSGTAVHETSGATSLVPGQTVIAAGERRPNAARTSVE